MKIAVFDTEEWEHKACLRLQLAHELSCTNDTLNTTSALKYDDAEIVSTFVNSSLSADILASFANLKLIATRSTGYDHIDLDYCKANGIVVCNVPDYGDLTVAEHVFTLLLATARHLVEAVERTRRGNFSQSGLRGFELRGKTLGVIGTGRIGRRVIEIANGFGMSVIAFDLYPDDAAAERLGFRYADFEEVLAVADIVTLHIPAGHKTKSLLSYHEFGMMKPGAILINTARGNIVDIPALVHTLAEGRLHAAGLDVLPQKPILRDEAEIFRADGSSEGFDLRSLVGNHVLLCFPNVIVTPHNAYNTDSAVGRIIEATLDNIEAFAKGEAKNVIV